MANGDTVFRIVITKNPVWSTIQWRTLNALDYEEEMLYRSQLCFSRMGYELLDALDEYRDNGGRLKKVFFNSLDGFISASSYEFLEEISRILESHVADATELINPIPANASRERRDYMQVWRDCIKGYAECGLEVLWVY
ncbi:hypothetical protein ACWJKU_13230 [Methylocaldum sp. MU1018]